MGPTHHELGAALRPAWAGVDLDALERNYRALAGVVAPASVLAVVKADAYGHGARRVGRALERAGVAQLGVALVEEGTELRRFGLEVPILVLGTTQSAQLALYRRYRLTPTISSLDQLELWLRWAEGETQPQPVHLKVDTGMGRLGIAVGEVATALDRLRGARSLRLAGFASHLAEADLLESEVTPRQLRAFRELLTLLTEAERESAVIHLANSAGALHHPGGRHDRVRIGMALFGGSPEPAPDSGLPDLEPVMSVSARVVQTRELPAGSRVSYGGRDTLSRDSRIGVVPIGYADGVPWRLTGTGAAMLCRGQRVPILGAVTMDMTLVDLTDVDGAVGDEVVLLGRQGDEQLDAAEIAERAGTIPYEILCGLGLRLPRSYRRDRRWSEVATRFANGDR